MMTFVQNRCDNYDITWPLLLSSCKDTKLNCESWKVKWRVRDVTIKQVLLSCVHFQTYVVPDWLNIIPDVHQTEQV